ncbi:MAG: DUF1571 domain-containing protein [Planctomycetaceae bacterium]|nr:DUF1571 domain-containing protein [Planctomycetaceae bacterium]
MTRALTSPARGSRGPNFCALLITGAVFGYITINSDPVISGTESLDATAAIGPPQITLPPAPPLSLRNAEREGLIEQPAVEEATVNVAPATADPDVLTGRWAMLLSVTMLQRGCEKFQHVSDYTATMYKQERIGGELLDGSTMSMKLRHEPFSVYMKWLDGDKGRQLIYVDGQNDGNLLVQLGGVKGRLLGTLSIDPTGSQAMAESRYPITGAGLLRLAKKIVEYRQHDLERGTGVHCEMYDNQELNGRPCYMFVTTYDGPEYSETYRKAVCYIDKELSMPVCVRNYTWAVDADPATIDDQTLIEFYSYSDIKIEQSLVAEDFDRANASYRMRR